jgi:hypothetical protein
MIDRKNRLEAQKPKVAKFSKIKERLDTLYKANSTAYDQISELKTKKKVLLDKLKIVNDQLNTIKASANVNNQNITNLKLQIASIIEENDKLYQQKKELNNEWNTKWRKYEDQQREIQYIDEALKKINMLKKRADKDKKRKDKLDKDNEDEVEVDNDGIEKPVEVPNAYEIATCQWLSKYFKSQTGEQTDKHEIKASTTNAQTNDDDKLKPLVRNDREHELGVSEQQQPKKKGKGPKVSKRDQKMESTGLLVLDSNVVNKIKDVKLNPPIYKKDVPEFLEKLDGAFKAYSSGTVRQQEKHKHPEVVKQVEKQKQEQENKKHHVVEQHHHEERVQKEHHHVEEHKVQHHEEPKQREEVRHVIIEEVHHHVEVPKHEEVHHVKEVPKHEEVHHVKEEPKHEEVHHIEEPKHEEVHHEEKPQEPEPEPEEKPQEEEPEKEPLAVEEPEEEQKSEEIQQEEEQEKPTIEEKHEVEHEKEQEKPHEEEPKVEETKEETVVQEPVLQTKSSIKVQMKQAVIFK